MSNCKQVQVFEVLADGPGDGPACDGTYVSRFRNRREAEAFATRSTCYGRPAKVQEDNVPRKLAQRWGLV